MSTTCRLERLREEADDLVVWGLKRRNDDQSEERERIDLVFP
jgi:hypothetical protein